MGKYLPAFYPDGLLTIQTRLRLEMLQYELFSLGLSKSISTFEEE